MNAPVEDGRQFETGIYAANTDEMFRWGRVPEVTVPAGTFSDCWQTYSNVATIEDIRIYCPGVGLVRRTLLNEEVLTGMTVEQLTHYEY